MAKLKDALRQSRFEPAFQPLVDLSSGAVVGFEVLARWVDPMVPGIGPAHFIPAAEQHGLIGPLTRQILSKGCTEALQFPGKPILAFNLSPIQFRDPDLFDFVIAIIEPTGFPMQRVHIEMTESALIGDDGVALTTVQRFKSVGIGVALDDFGTGFASLTRLHAFPFETLKIDASFVRAMETDSGSRKIVASVIGLGQSLGMTIVAEGVETERQATILRRLGCDIAQGWLFGKPAPAQEIVKSFPFSSGGMPKKLTGVSPLQRFHQLEALYKDAPIALGFAGLDLRYVSVNDRLTQILGLPAAEIVGHSITERLPARHKIALTRLLQRIIDGQTIRSHEFSDRASHHSYLVSCQHVCDDVGDTIGLSITAIDITQRKAAEVALKADEEHFRRSVELSPNVAWAAKPSGEVDYMSPALGLGEATTMADRISDWYGRMHEQDMARVRQEWLAWLPTQQPFSTEFRIKWNDGEWRWVLSRANPFFNSRGQLERWYGVISDISDQKFLEAKVVGMASLTQDVAGAEVLKLFR
ncbi:EAL domain-containing protein [Rhizobium sp. PL01]|uniref:sensor domain-containing phosphodiesterase n=1 Tax=Rhizobium sp. PL01 TaxID=3085631 RepID=UPI0029829F30|nr:EAL domain-containing protein [Rhizobium sp. PL01]MDW5317472.1 EAL domain-containing protein [Rhizobium sp. PL01]